MDPLEETVAKLRKELDAEKDKVKEKDEELASERDKASKAEDGMSVVYVDKKKLSILKGRQYAKSDVNVAEWITEVRGHLNMRKLNKDCQKEFILNHLSNEAKWEIEYRKQTDPDIILQTLGDIFGEPDSSASLYQDLFSRCQREEETVLEYCIALMRISSKIAKKETAPSETLLKGRFVEGVKSEALQRELRRVNADKSTLTLWELRDKGLQWLGLDETERVTSAREITAEIPEWKADLEKQSEKLEELTGMVSAALQIQKVTAVQNTGCPTPLSQVSEQAVTNMQNPSSWEQPSRIPAWTPSAPPQQPDFNGQMGRGNQFRRGWGYSRGRGRGTWRGRGYQGTGGRACYICNDKNHMCRDCPTLKELKQGQQDVNMAAGERDHPK